MKKIIILFIVFFATHQLSARGLWRSTRFDLAAGISGKTEANTSISPEGVVNNSFQGNGALVFVGLGKHVNNGLWGEIRFSMQALEATQEISGTKVSNHAVVLMPMMLGVRQYFLHNVETGFQPSVFILGGLVAGFETRQEVGLITKTESHSESSLGAQVGGSVDILLTNWLSLQFGGAYLFMQDFSTPFNGQVNFDGWSASFGLSIFIGRQ